MLELWLDRCSAGDVQQIHFSYLHDTDVLQQQHSDSDHPAVVGRSALGQRPTQRPIEEEG